MICVINKFREEIRKETKRLARINLPIMLSKPSQLVSLETFNSWACIDVEFKVRNRDSLGMVAKEHTAKIMKE